MQRRIGGAAQRQAVADRVRALLPLDADGTVTAPIRFDAGPVDEADPLDDGPSAERDPDAAPARGAAARYRFAAGHRSVLAIGLVALVVAAASLWWVLGDRPRPGADPIGLVTPAAPSVPAALPADASAVAASAASPIGRSSGGSAGGSSASASRAATVVVDVVGRVNRAGVYLLPAGSRVDDAISAAGGLQPGVDASALNLARRLNDGEQIAVGVPGATAAPGAVSAGSAGPSGAPAAAGPVNLNDATAEQLDALPGVGPVLAKNIVDWRTAHGRFDRIEQLLEVSGIGAAKFATLKTAVTV